MKKHLLFFLALIALCAPAVAQNSVGPIGPGPQPTFAAIKILGQDNVPMIMVGSGSMANNGALTLTTGLAATPAITSAYIFLPASAIVSGSSAGWYYALFSSTTAATVYNNTYSSGTPAIPSSPVAFATTGPGAYLGTTGQTTAYSLSIPGNLLGINGGLRVSAAFSYTNAAGTKTLAIAYGSMNLLNGTATTTASSAGMWGFRNQGAPGAQLSIAPNGQSPFDITSNTLNNGTVDTTSAQTLAIKLTNATPASNNLMIANASVELMPGVP